MNFAGLILALLILASAPCVLRAGRVLDTNPDFLVENWLAVDGIPESSALALAQTPDGYIWVGSSDGLLRFNGFSFAQVAPPDGLERLLGTIIRLVADRSGRLWVSSHGGMACLDAGGWHAVSGAVHEARSFAEDATGEMFFGTFDGKVFAIKNFQVQEIEQPAGLFGSGVFCLSDARDGGIWLANRTFVGRRDGAGWKRLGPSGTNAVPLLAAPARDGGIWVLMRGQLDRYRADGSVARTPAPDVADFREMMEDTSGVIWIATTTRGLARLVPNGPGWEARTITATNGLAQDSVWSLLQDREGNLWAGGASGGLHRLSPRQFVNIGLGQGLPSNVARAVAEIAPGRILVGTQGAGTTEIVKGKVASIRPVAPGLAGLNCWCLLKDASSRLWIGTYGGGLFVEDDGIRRRVPLPPALGQNINSLMEDSGGRVWVGTGAGVGLVEKGASRALPESVSSVVDNANCMAGDPRSGAIWIGTTDRGLFRLTGENFARVERIEGLPSDRITSLSIDKDGCVWAGVFARGLASVRGQSVTLFGPGQGLAAGIVASMVDDGQGFLWMGTDRGIARVANEELHRVQRKEAAGATFTMFDQHDGVGWGNCADGTQPAALKDAYGRLWFATLNGVVIADPSMFRPNTNPPPVMMESVIFTDRSGQKRELIAPFATLLRVPAGGDELEFHFAALSYTSPDKARLSYLLEGAGPNTNWLDIGNRHELVFHSPLAPGGYTLRVRARNNDGVWSQKEASLAFAVEPFFWQTLLFRVFAVTGLSGGASAAAWRATRTRYQRRIVQLQNQRALEEEQARLAAVMEATSDLVAFADRDGLVLHLNPAGRKLLGYGPSAEISGLNLASIFPAWAAHRFASEAIPAARLLGTWEGESALVARDGREIPVSQVIIAHRGAGGQINFVSTVARDITERKQAEKEKERLLEELLQSRKMESVGRLAGGIAHDFNNMMQVVLGNTSLALELCPPGGELRAHLAEIESSAKRSAELTRHLLAFARKQKVQPKAMDLNETVAGMLKVLGRLIGENITLSWVPGGGLWPVTMDPLQIDQILANLAVNARDAIGGHGVVAIQTANVTMDETLVRGRADRVCGEFVELSVGDTGKGMTPEIAQRIFEPFFTTKEVGEGTGLGLATVYGIVQQNHGWIEVDTGPGRGSTFKVFLPRAKTAVAPSGADAPVVAVRPGGNETILVAEDEPSILELSAKILRQYGYKVITAESPERALELAAGEPGQIHLLVTDVVMPGMSGKELRDKLRTFRPGLKCLFMSGYDKNLFGAQGAGETGQGFLQKPFTRDELANLARDLLGEPLA
jgi:PAS domain S-box-containing protein